MTMLKTLCRKSGGCTQIQEYISKEGRCLAYDYSDSVMDHENWGSDFDSVRRFYGKDTGRKYYHLILSPDPDDGCDLDTLRDLARSWMSERYPDAQYVIGYHNDNGRIHAHIAMNSVLPDSGYKIQISDEDVLADATTLQRMSRDRGLSYFEKPRPSKDDDGYSTTRGAARRPAVVMTDAERRIVARGMRSWKWEIRDAIDDCIAESGVRTWEDFSRAMERRGYRAVLGRRGVATFYHPDSSGTRKTVRGTPDNLGSAYTVSGIMLRMTRSDGRVCAGVIPSRQIEKIVLPSNIEQRIEIRGRRRPWVSPQDVMDLIGIMRSNGYGDAGELKTALSRVRSAIERDRVALAELEARRAFLDNADAKYLRLVELREDGMTFAMSFEAFAEEQSIEQWFYDHGTTADAYAAVSERERAGVRNAASSIAERNDGLEREMKALVDAMRTAERIGLETGRPPSQAARIRGAGGMAAFKLRVIASRDELAEMHGHALEETARKLERSGQDELKTLAYVQREMLLRKQIEERAGEVEAGGVTEEAEVVAAQEFKTEEFNRPIGAERGADKKRST